MLTLNDGRNELWQWDTKRKLTVDTECSQVHFSNKVFGRSIDVDVVDGVASIPDILLQTDKELTAWAFVGTPENGYTKISKVFKVNKRNKPADYVFTPTEQTTLGEIVKRLDQIEESQDPDAIKNAVDDYLANNPIKVNETDPTVPDWAKQPMKPWYTASEVGAVATVNGIEPDEDGNVELKVETATPDWNAAEGEPGHIKSRTHWYDFEEITFAEDKTVNKTGFSTVSWLTYDKVKDCATARVIFNGVEYVCPVTVRIDFTEYGDESYFYIGNFQDGAPQYPFCFWGYILNNFAIVNAEDGTHTVSVYGRKEVVHKLPEKYLPESVVQVESVKKAVNPYFEGDIEGYTFLMFDALNEGDGIGGLVKITGYVLTEEECLGATVTISYQGLTSNDAITKKVDFTDAVGLPCDAYYADGSSAPYVVVIKSSGIGSGIVEGVEVSAGTYYLYVDTSGMDGGKTFITHFSALDNKEVVEEKINPKYLPNEVALKSDIPSIEGLASEEYVNDAIANLPTGGGGDSVEVLIEDTLTEAVTTYERAFTDEEITKINSARGVRFTLNTFSSAYSLDGIKFGIYRPTWYSFCMHFVNNASLSIATNQWQMIIASYLNLFRSTPPVYSTTTAQVITGIKDNTTVGTRVPETTLLNNKDSIKLVTTTEAGFPIGTVIKVEVLL